MLYQDLRQLPDGVRRKVSVELAKVITDELKTPLGLMAEVYAEIITARVLRKMTLIGRQIRRGSFT